PLRDSTHRLRLPVRESLGTTAGEQQISMVTHESRDYLGYEAIRSGRNGRPNVLISRDGATGESAYHGDGFYTAVGSTGGTRTGFHVRMKVDPSAREGSDFVRVSRDWILWLTRDKLTVVHE